MQNLKEKLVRNETHASHDSPLPPPPPDPTKKIINAPVLLLSGTLFITGLMLTLYDSGFGQYAGRWYTHYYPFQLIGIILLLIGISFAGLELFYGRKNSVKITFG